jgi:hypothetical protein
MGVSGALFSDEPLGHEDPMPVGRQHFIDRAVDIARAIGAKDSSTVLALIGPWGSGKTSILNAIVGRLREADDRVTVSEFNPWMVTSLEDLVAEFLETVASELPESGQRKLREEIARLVSRAGRIARLVDVTGKSEGSIDALVELLAPEGTLAERRRGLMDSLDTFDGSIFIVLDDIDRLQPEELTLVFKLVRSVGRLPRVHYLLAFDEETLLEVLGQAGAVAHDRARALAYLEKMVQFRLDVPPLHWTDRAALWAAGLDEILEHHDIRLADLDRHRLDLAYETAMATRLTTPRATKRFLGQLETAWPLLLHEVDPVDFVLVTFLRVFEPSLYLELAFQRELLTGDSPVNLIKQPEDARRQLREWWEEVAPSSRAQQSSSLLKVVAMLFPRVADSLEVGAPIAERGSEQGVRDSHYFDRYFQMGVPADDLSDERVRALLANVDLESFFEAVSGLLEEGGHAPDRLVDKIIRFAPRGAQAGPGLFALACHIDPQLGSGSVSSGAMARLRLRSFAREVVARATHADAEELFDAIGDDPSHQIAAAHALVRALPLENPKEEEAADAKLRPLRAALTRRLKRAADEFATARVDGDSALVDVLIAWHWLSRDHQSEVVRPWVLGRIDDQECPWRAIDVLAACVATATSSRGGAQITSLSQLPPDRVRVLIGPDEAMRRTSSIAVPTGSLDDLRASQDLSMSARRAFVLLSLAAKRESIDASTPSYNKPKDR